MDTVARFVAKIQADIRDFERKVNRAMAKAERMPDEIVTEIKADIDKFRRGLLQAEALARAFQSRDIEKKVRVDATGFRGLYHSFKNNFTDPFNARMGELADNIRTFGTVFGNMIKGSLITSFSALVPIIAGVTSAVMALGNAIGVAFGVALGTVGALAVSFGGAAAYGGLLASVIARYNDEAFIATEASNAFASSMDTLKSSWSGIVDSHIDSIFNQMSTALGAANHGLQEMTPFIDGVVNSMGSLIDRVHEFVTGSTVMENFFNNMNTTGVKIFDNVANAAMSFTEGLFSSMNGLMPLFDWTAQGLNNLAERFSSWAQSMESENGFSKFIDYVKENLPKIGSIFGNTFRGIINLFAAFGENSSSVFDGLQRMTERFREWSAAIKESDGFQKFIDYIQTNGPTVISLIGGIIGTIVAFGVALAPLGQKVLDVADSFFEFTNNLLEANPNIGEFIGWVTVLAGAFMMVLPAATAIITAIQGLLTPIMAAVTAFINLKSEVGFVQAVFTTLQGAFTLVNVAIMAVVGIVLLLVSTFIYLWNTNEDFRNRVIEIWDQIKEYLNQAITAISTFIMDIWGRLVQWWDENNELIVTTITNAWNRILTIIEVAMAILVPIIQVAWELIKMIIRVALEIILGIITTVMAIMNGDWATAWETIKTTVSNVWGIIKEHIRNVIEILKPIILEFATKVYEWIKEKFEQAKNIVMSIWSFVKFYIESKIAQILINVITKFEEIKQAIKDKLEQAKLTVETIWHLILGSIRKKINEIKNDVQTKFQEIKQTIENKTNEAKTALINKFTEMVTNARNKATEILTAIRDKFTEIKTTVQNKITEAKNELVNKMSEMVTNARNKAQEVYNGIKEKISEVPSMVGGIISDAASAVSAKAGEFVSAGKDLIRGLIDGIKNMAGDAVAAAKSVVGDAIAGAKNLLGINSPSRVFRSFGEYTMQGLEIGINRMASRAVGAVTDVARDMTNSFAPDLTTTADIDGQIGNFNRELRSTVDADIQSGIETQRPIVNITVRNESDIPAIKSWIEEETAVEDSLAF